ncbi:MAG: recombination mediator RecR [Verrucomicrobiota bacterium]|jgi:recombination protein RecR|nr:recombination mediator RecR [Verrucomicrobiota bacterium]MDI9384119.1 recombination mediator RecR [Verrucomicrobiota bacterium]HCF94489.1 recombination protein RecR [Verrucomicrobiota bacterium]
MAKDVRVYYPASIRAALEGLTTLPGLGPRSAERMVQHLLSMDTELVIRLADSLRGLVSRVRPCAVCGFYAEIEEAEAVEAKCVFCADARRDSALVCVVEQPQDVVRIESTGAFAGLFHVLGGRISPLDGVGPEDLRIAPLLARIRAGGIGELIFALGGDLEGETTAHYLVDCVSRLGLEHTPKLTRIAQGVPVGSGLEFADAASIQRALGSRTLFED